MIRTTKSLIKALHKMVDEHESQEQDLANDYANLGEMLNDEPDTITEERIYHLANEAALFEDEIEELIDLADTQI